MKEKLFTRNFVLLVLGQASSLFGNYILRLALSMYVLETTGSAAIFAGILSIAIVPTILLSPFGGILADRMDRRKLMVVLDTLTSISVFCGAVFLWENQGLTVISVLLVALSVFGAFETPTVQACIPQMLTGDNIIRGNAVVNQVASLSYLTGPFLGGVLYTAFGLKPVMYASVVCFLITALLECFIKLDYEPGVYSGNVLSMIKNDFLSSVQFMTRERRDILKMLFLVALSRFFVMGVTLVGLPFLVRTLLGLDAKYYGGAESALAVATILGSLGAGLLTGRMKAGRLSWVLAAMGVCMLPAGLVFLFPSGIALRYVVHVIAFAGTQAAISIFSIFAVSLIQQNTPNHLLGKVMAYTGAITMCTQPAGQMVYGFLFDGFREAVYLVLLSTGILVCGIGLASAEFFRSLEKNKNIRSDGADEKREDGDYHIHQ
ncbi:MAG: MFS transporter [Lachnospiraceae bacterium]|nr:MFS transporter [Lachnospiraceae bacterium]